MQLKSGDKYLSVNGRDEVRQLILNWEVDAAGLTIYKGVAAPGTANDAAGWLIEKITNPASPGVGTIRLSAENQVWDDRASLTYT